MISRVLGIVKDTREVENVQMDLEETFNWAGKNNMQFNETTFELFRYGKNNCPKTMFSYYSSNKEEAYECKTMIYFMNKLQRRVAEDSVPEFLTFVSYLCSPQELSIPAHQVYQAKRG
jgi:hypothetical protein